MNFLLSQGGGLAPENNLNLNFTTGERIQGLNPKHMKSLVRRGVGMIFRSRQL